MLPETLIFAPAIDRPDLISPSVLNMLQHWEGSVPVQDIQVAEIDPAYAGGAELCKHYKIPTEQGANCVIVEATRGASSILAACLSPVNYRLDLNGIVRKTLNARRVSLAPLDRVLQLTGMEYGSITPLGLASEWPILIDQHVTLSTNVVIGSGLLKAKLRLPVQALIGLPTARIIENLAALK